MQIGQLIGRVLSFLPVEFKELLKKKLDGEITQDELQKRLDAFTLSNLDELKPWKKPYKSVALIEYEQLTKKEQKALDDVEIKKIAGLKVNWELANNKTKIRNATNLKELTDLLGRLKNNGYDTQKVEAIIAQYANDEIELPDWQFCISKDAI